LRSRDIFIFIRHGAQALSNDSNVGSEAFFDDFSIQVSESFIVQQTDYYPYGLIAKNWTRVGDKPTKDLFQGKTYEDLTKWYDFHARQYDAALGRWFGTDPQNQFASPYLAMGNNPVSLVDPDGEFVIPLMIVGAFMNTIFQNATGNVNNFGDFIKSMAVGALSGAAGFGAGQFVAGAVGTIGFTGGALTGGFGGFASGFVGGAGNAWSSGSSFGIGLKSGAKAGAFGALLGGVFGGLSGGSQALKHGGNFWSGKGATFDAAGLINDVTQVGNELEFNNNYAKNFSDEYFGKDIKGLNELYADGSLPKGYTTKGDIVLTSAGNPTRGSTVYLGTGKGSKVYLYRAAFASKEQLYMTMGHEYLHVGFNINRNIYSSSARQESAIAQWQLDQANFWKFDVSYYRAVHQKFGSVIPYSLKQNPNYFPPISIRPWLH